jgi:ribosomal protein S27AE
MKFFDTVLPMVASIQEIKRKTCPKCGKRMYLARWFSMWTCENCDTCIDFTDEERKLVDKFEQHYRLTKTRRRGGSLAWTRRSKK